MSKPFEKSASFLEKLQTIQVQLAERLFGKNTEEAKSKWVGQGYAEQFRTIINAQSDFKKRIQENDWTVLEDIYKLLNTNNEK